MTAIDRILVPVDFSECSRAALDQALFLGERFGAAIDVLHVWDIPGYLRPDLTVWSGDVSASLADHARRDAEKNLDEFLNAAGAKGRDNVNTTVICGVPYAAILAAIEDGSYDMIVMGTHGRTGVSHVLVGSVAERVVRRSPCPVMTVPATASSAKSAA